eukprot:CAMPEP_0171322934 /NCGR_PEP_ID=MMETSP0816-20121228/115264_1 /TAXON_ID=420281 /ORGANISM="Proboscia inermis, Strain CCAP1064/1" /LENGTH=305 /DNA_ID=CAMNT_0011821523 /DNA_START=68 /DNA_END=988 /DNA_ORIENTATION=+
MESISKSGGILSTTIDGSSTYNSNSFEKNGSVKVCLRLRPMNKLETSRRSKNCVEVHYDTDNSLTVDSPLDGEFDFTFDKVFDDIAPQEDIHETVGMPAVEDFLDGYNTASWSMVKQERDIGLLSTGIAQAHLAIQSVFPNEWSEFTSVKNSSRNNSTPSIGGRILGSVGFPPSAIWIEDGVGMVGPSETHANEVVPQGDWVTTTVYFNDPSDDMLKLVFQISTGRILKVHIFSADADEMNTTVGSVNNPLENNIWHVVKSVPPAVTYAEVLMQAYYRAVDLIHDTNHPSLNKKHNHTNANASAN